MICYVNGAGCLRRPVRRARAEEIEVDDAQRGIELVVSWWRAVCANYRDHGSYGIVSIMADFEKGDPKMVRLRDEVVVKLPLQE